MSRVATTRFLLGRRGRHLYPPRNTTTKAPILLDDTNKNNHNNSGRHGVPAPKPPPSWNSCRKQPQAYAYGFPIVPPTTKSSGSWTTSPVVWITLLLLSACFVGAYFLVLRIDQSLQDTLQPRSGSNNNNNKYPRGSLKTILVTKEQEPPLAARLVPLYLNLTLFQIPCQGLTVQVVAHNNVTGTEAEEASDRLIFKNLVEERQSSTATITSRNLAAKDNPPTMEFQHLNPQQHKSQADLQRRRLEDRAAEEEGSGEEEAEKREGKEDSNSNRELDGGASTTEEMRPTTGCQIMGHLQLPIGNHQQPAIVSFKANNHHHHHINLSHRVDQLKIGSTRSFPKEESLVLQKFRPHIYTNQEDTTHRYNVYDNFHLVEQESSLSSSSSSGSAEIQLVFAPSQRRHR